MGWATDANRSLTYSTGSNYTDLQSACINTGNVQLENGPGRGWCSSRRVEWTDVDDMTAEQQASIGYKGQEEWCYLYLTPPDEADMLDITVKLKITDSLEGFDDAEGWVTHSCLRHVGQPRQLFGCWQRQRTA